MILIKCRSQLFVKIAIDSVFIRLNSYNHNRITSGYESYFDTSISGKIWTNSDGRLAIISENSHMLITTEYPTDCFCIVFASDRNDGYAKVYVDGEKVWEGDTWASPGRGQPISAQTIRSLKITGLESSTHSIKIENPNVDHVHNGHVTIYKYGYNCSNTEIPEYPTIALPMAAILGLAFVFQRRKE
ncbi:PEF-CTERM sorting domain-containing protein [Methanolobus sp. ZRKC4]|uniref:PEF-CTERM sorting domain-containing protein n=1 Tax=Methanolobus sp. ZRKC4 TaxID=3125787 RepID=UPI0032504BD5